MSFTGMDIPAVRQLAALFGQKADEIDQIRTLLTNQLSSTSWVGPDQQRFTGEWNGQYSTALVNVANALRDAQNVSTQNANEQESASA